MKKKIALCVWLYWFWSTWDWELSRTKSQNFCISCLMGMVIFPNKSAVGTNSFGCVHAILAIAAGSAQTFPAATVHFLRNHHALWHIYALAVRPLKSHLMACATIVYQHLRTFEALRVWTKFPCARAERNCNCISIRKHRQSPSTDWWHRYDWKDKQII